MGDVGTALEEAGLGNIPHLLAAIQQVAPTVAELRSLSQEDLDQAVSTLGLKPMALRKVQASLTGLRASDAGGIHRGFDFGADKIDQVALTPRSQAQRRSSSGSNPSPPTRKATPPAAVVASSPPPPPSSTPADGSRHVPVVPPPLNIAPAIDIADAPVFTPRGGNVIPPAHDGPVFTPRGGTMISAGAGPVFTPRGGTILASGGGGADGDIEGISFTPRGSKRPAGLAPLSINTAEAQAVQQRLATGGFSMPYGDDDDDDGPPTFTPRTMAFLDGEPIFTPRALGSAGAATLPPPALLDVTGDDDDFIVGGDMPFLDDPVVTPRAIGSSAGVNGLKLSTSTTAAIEGDADTDAPMFTPRTMAFLGGEPRADGEDDMPIFTPRALDIDDYDEFAAAEAEAAARLGGGAAADCGDEDTSPAAKGAKKAQPKAKKGAKGEAAAAAKPKSKSTKAGAEKVTAAKKPAATKKGGSGSKGGATQTTNFVISVRGADGSDAGSLQTTLEPRQLDKPLTRAIIDPALDALNLKGVKVAYVRVDDQVGGRP